MSRNTVVFIIFLIVISTPFALLDYAHFPYSDGAEHGAAVRALAEDMLHPGDPILNGINGGSPRYVPSILVMALVMRLFPVDVLVILKLFLIIYFTLFLVSVGLFSSEYFNDSGQAPWSIACLLFLWGLGWNGANAYMFSAILYTAYYPSVVSFSLAFLALYFQLRFLRSERKAFLVGALLSGAFSFVNHPLTGAFFLICSGLVYLEREGLSKKALFCYTLSIITALCLTVLWPYYNFLASLMTVASGEMQKTLDYISTRQFLYSKVLLRSGAALAGIPIASYYLRRRRYLLLWGGVLLFGLLYLYGFYGNLSLAERCIFFVLCFLQIAVSRLCRELSDTNVWRAQRGINKVIFYSLILLLGGGIATQAVLTFKEFVYPSFSFAAGSPFPRYINPNAMHHELKKYLRDGDVVLSDVYSSWAVPVYTGAKIIALFHTAPHVTDNIQRIADVEVFYNVTTPNSVRNAIVKKYGVTHIFLHFKIDGRQLDPILEGMGYHKVFRANEFCIFSVLK
ncbi:MAG: hypothetical protein NTV89_04810 [Proteobacteria bacterium]|nr:hypothetical protein [Pseudomonadota bacterium]